MAFLLFSIKKATWRLSAHHKSTGLEHSISLYQSLLNLVDTFYLTILTFATCSHWWREFRSKHLLVIFRSRPVMRSKWKRPFGMAPSHQPRNWDALCKSKKFRTSTCSEVLWSFSRKICPQKILQKSTNFQENLMDVLKNYQIERLYSKHEIRNTNNHNCNEIQNI